MLCATTFFFSKKIWDFGTKLGSPFTEQFHAVVTELLDKMADTSLAEKLDKIKSPGLQSQQRVRLDSGCFLC